MGDGALFDATPYEVPAGPDPYEGMGQDARRTARRRELLEQGIHPITKQPTRPDLGTCGDCANLVVKDIGRARHWFKCRLTLTVSHGSYPSGPDVRKSYPACTGFKSKEASS
jgi:hypothetical protein